jgi:hypothetical protein
LGTGDIHPDLGVFAILDHLGTAGIGHACYLDIMV